MTTLMDEYNKNTAAAIKKMKNGYEINEDNWGLFFVEMAEQGLGVSMEGPCENDPEAGGWRAGVESCTKDAKTPWEALDEAYCQFLCEMRFTDEWVDFPDFADIVNGIKRRGYAFPVRIMRSVQKPKCVDYDPNLNI